MDEQQRDELARTVAIIMDGNGRWAERRGLPVAEGHRAGTRALRRTVEAAIDLGVETLVVYAFSTENWSRSDEEVEDLMEIFGETIQRELPDLARQGVRARFLGRRDRAPEELREQMEQLEDETAHAPVFIVPAFVAPQEADHDRRALRNGGERRKLGEPLRITRTDAQSHH